MAVKTNKKSGKKIKRKRGSFLWLLLFIPIITGIILSIMPSQSSVKTAGVQFQNEGYLQFLRSSDQKPLTAINIELATDDESRERGLMWRKSMRENEGMLFVMEESEIQSFWMLNTYIPLDIIFVDEHKTIVTIRANTVPQSLKPERSDRPALYVVEVNAGFCKKYGISPGDRISFDLLGR